MNTPAGKLNTSQGIVAINPIIESKSGERVIDEAIHGYATADTPLPRFERTLAVKSL